MKKERLKSLLKAYVLKMKDKPQIKGMNLFPFDGEEGNKSRVLFSAHPCLPLVLSLFFECRCSRLHWSARTYGERNRTHSSTPRWKCEDATHCHYFTRGDVIGRVSTLQLWSSDFCWSWKLCLRLHCSLYFIRRMVVTAVQHHFTNCLGNIFLIMKTNMNLQVVFLQRLEGEKKWRIWRTQLKTQKTRGKLENTQGPDESNLGSSLTTPENRECCSVWSRIHSFSTKNWNLTTQPAAWSYLKSPLCCCVSETVLARSLQHSGWLPMDAGPGFCVVSGVLLGHIQPEAVVSSSPHIQAI